MSPGRLAEEAATTPVLAAIRAATITHTNVHRKITLRLSARAKRLFRLKRASTCRSMRSTLDAGMLAGHAARARRAVSTSSGDI